MRTILAIIQKEFLQVFRNKILSRMIFIIPVVQLIVLVFAANFEVDNLSLGFIDKDNSSISREVKNHLFGSGYFILKDVPKNYHEALEDFEDNKIDVILEIPANFHQDIVRGLTPRIAISVNAINSMKAGLAASYVGAVISQINKKISDSIHVCHSWHRIFNFYNIRDTITGNVCRIVLYVSFNTIKWTVYPN